MKRLALGFVSVLVLAWTVFIGWDGWVNAHRIVAGPANESAFYQNYNPEEVIKRFRFEGEGYGGGGGKGASQGIKSIRHNTEFFPRFTIQADRKGDLMIALREDIVSWFRITGTQLTGDQQESNGGFTFKYDAGNSIGSISVQAPVHDPGIHRQCQLRAGLDDISVNIALEETRTRPASESRWWMAAVD